MLDFSLQLPSAATGENPRVLAQIGSPNLLYRDVTAIEPDFFVVSDDFGPDRSGRRIRRFLRFTALTKHRDTCAVDGSTWLTRPGPT